MVRFYDLAEDQKLLAVESFHRDTGLNRSFSESLAAFARILRTIPHWDAETGEPSLGTGNFPQKG